MFTPTPEGLALARAAGASPSQAELAEALTALTGQAYTVGRCDSPGLQVSNCTYRQRYQDLRRLLNQFTSTSQTDSVMSAKTFKVLPAFVGTTATFEAAPGITQAIKAGKTVTEEEARALVAAGFDHFLEEQPAPLKPAKPESKAPAKPAAKAPAKPESKAPEGAETPKTETEAPTA